MSKNKRRKPNNDAAPMEVDEVVTNANGGGPSNATNGALSESEDEYDHISDDEEGGFRLGDIYIPPAPKPALTFDATGPRLVISHIIIENFKSYAGKQYLGPFHKSFTSIIGPNGSGKSNVIDSMLFVFGYRATKIRSKNIRVLIHTSNKHTNIESASVAVFFHQIIDGPDGSFTIVPGSEMQISRTVFNDFSSHYTLNDRRVQFKEVAAMLRSYGIDLDRNRFLILQGEVEQIAMMKPKAQAAHECGMLEYLEEIVGTTRYKVPIDKLSVKVAELTDKRKEKLNRVRLVEFEKTNLEEPMRQAVEHINLCNQTTAYRNMLLQKYIYEIRKMSLEKEDLKVRTEIKLDEVKDRVVAVNKEIEEKNLIVKEGSQKLTALKKKKDEIKARLYAIVQKTAAVEMDLKKATEKSGNLRQLIQQEKSKLIEYQMIPEKNAKDIEECKKLLKKHHENLNKAEEERKAILDGNKERTRGLNEIRQRLTAKLPRLQLILDKAKTAHDLAQKELNIYVSSKKNAMEQLEKEKAAYSNAISQLERNKQLKEELTSSLPQKEKHLKELQSKLQNYKRQETEMASKVRTLRSQVEESTQRMTANRSRNKVLDSLMKEKRNGNIPGIFARLGDLGGIDQKYDIAISTSCGALDHVLTDNVDTATACVDFLKKYDIGRASFIALDKQTHLKRFYEKREKYPEGVPRLFDLIKVTDERVLPAFYFALRDTLVAETLDQATRIAYGTPRYRVVTLMGDVIEIYGTMAGGGKSVIRGRMGTSVREDTRDVDSEAIQANERKLEKLNQSLIDNRAQQNVMETEINTLQTTVREGRDMLHKINYDLKDLTKQVPTIKKRIEELERKIASQSEEDRTAELESPIAEAKERLDKAEFDAGELKKEIAELDDQISALVGGRINEVQKNVNDLANKIKKLDTEIRRLNAGIGNSERKAKNSSDSIAVMEADLAVTETNLAKFNAQKKKITLDNAELKKELEEVNEKISETPSQFAGVQAQKAKLEEKLIKIKNESIELSGEVTKIQKLIDEYAKKTPHWENELRNLKQETIEPDDTGITIPGLEPVEPLKVHTDEELEAANVEELRARVTVQKQRMGEDKPNIRAVLEYRAKEALYLKRAADLESITSKRNEAREVYDGLKKRRQTEFLAGFNTITAKLKELYQMITLGGDAELELVDSLDPFTEGIVFSVRPPNKSWKNISNLSGGEKTLSSLALVFALHYYKPTPLYVMDEIDAALDFKNVSIVANYIKERTKNAQFIVISLRYIMFEASNRLVGIYKTEDCTRSVCIENRHESPEKESCLDI